MCNQINSNFRAIIEIDFERLQECLSGNLLAPKEKGRKEKQEINIHRFRLISTYQSLPYVVYSFFVTSYTLSAVNRTPIDVVVVFSSFSCIWRRFSSVASSPTLLVPIFTSRMTGIEKFVVKSSMMMRSLKKGRKGKEGIRRDQKKNL
jgi:hypothetical protein